MATGTMRLPREEGVTLKIEQPVLLGTPEVGIPEHVCHIITSFLPRKDILSLKLTSKVHFSALIFFQDVQSLLDVAYTLAVKLRFYAQTKNISPSSALVKYQAEQQKVEGIYQNFFKNFWLTVSNDIESITSFSEQEMIDLLYLNPKTLSLLPKQARSTALFQQIALLSWTSKQPFFGVDACLQALHFARMLHEIAEDRPDGAKRFFWSNNQSVLDHDILKMYEEIERWDPNKEHLYQHNFTFWQSAMSKLPFVDEWNLQKLLDNNPEYSPYFPIKRIQAIIGLQTSISSTTLSPRLRWLCAEAPMLYVYLWPQVEALKDDKELSIITIRQCHGKMIKVANPKFSFDKECLFHLLCTHIGPEIYKRDIKPYLPTALQQDVELLEMEEQAAIDKPNRLQYHYADYMYINSGGWEKEFFTLSSDQ